MDSGRMELQVMLQDCFSGFVLGSRANCDWRVLCICWHDASVRKPWGTGVEFTGADVAIWKLYSWDPSQVLKCPLYCAVFVENRRKILENNKNT